MEASRVPLKVKVFYWFTLKKRLLTADNLLKMGGVVTRLAFCAARKGKLWTTCSQLVSLLNSFS